MARKLRKAKRTPSRAKRTTSTARRTTTKRPKRSTDRTRRATGMKAREKTTKARGKRTRPAPRARERSAGAKRAATTTRPSSTRARRTRQGEAANVAPVTADVPSFPEEQIVSDAERARQTADAMVGDEEPGGSVTVPEHDEVDQWAGALGVERSPDSPVRSSAELLADRDRRRGSRPPEPKI